VLAENVRWLAGYRHPRHHVSDTVGVLLQAFAEPAPLLAGAGAAGRPIVVLPVLFHLLWTGWLRTELSMPLSEISRIWRAS
jgi:metallophosphoesterase superfamily enzyme